MSFCPLLMKLGKHKLGGESSKGWKMLAISAGFIHKKHSFTAFTDLSQTGQLSWLLLGCTLKQIRHN